MKIDDPKTPFNDESPEEDPEAANETAEVDPEL